MTYYGQNGKPVRHTTTPYRQWPWWKRVIEQVYRLTHRGQIRTLVIRAAERGRVTGG